MPKLLLRYLPHIAICLLVFLGYQYVTGLQETNDDLQKALKSAKGEVSKLTDDLRNAEVVNQDAQDEIERLLAERETTQAQLAALNQRATNRERELERSLSNLEKELSRNEETGTSDNCSFTRMPDAVIRVFNNPAGAGGDHQDGGEEN